MTTLINFTPDPLETAYYAFQNMHNKIGTVVKPFENKSIKIQFLETLSRIPHQTVLEFIKTNWHIEGSRAFQQQLTRTRVAAYSIQSLRIVNVGTFADDKYYYVSKKLKDKKRFHIAMKDSQDHYNELIKMGEPVEDARGVLPLNILSPITMTINLRSLVHMMELRMCKNAQGEFRDIAKQMYKEVEQKIDSDFSRIFFKPPCQKIGVCPSPVPCDLVPSVYKKTISGDVENIGIMG